MSDSETLLKASLAEIERLFQSRTVVGEPIHVGDTTIIPLISVGIGYGAGGGGGKSDDGTGSGAGAAVGGGIKPVAVIIAGKDGVRVEPIASGSGAALLSKLADLANALLDKNKPEKLPKTDKDTAE